MMKIAVTQIGARMHYAVPKIFEEAGFLERLFTDSYIGNKPWLEACLRALPKRFRPREVDRLLGRKQLAVPFSKVTSFDLLGLRTTWRLSHADTSGQQRRIFAESNKVFCERIIARGIGQADTIWGFNTASLELFEWARVHGVRCILEQTIVPRRVERALLAAELRRWPGWQPGMDQLEEGDPLAAREEAEWQLADLIIAGSQVVVQGLVACGVPEEKCRVVPYGIDIEPFRRNRASERSLSDPMRVLFAGEVGLRKGAPYFLEALRQISRSCRIEARLVGHVALSASKVAAYSDIAHFPGPVPRTKMPDLYQWADMFVLPSICEGSATVTYEALASGVPVVCTPNAGSLVQDGVNGRLVPAGDIEPLAELLHHCATHQEEVARLRHGARAGVAMLSIDAYRERLLHAVNSPFTPAQRRMDDTSDGSRRQLQATPAVAESYSEC